MRIVTDRVSQAVDAFILDRGSAVVTTALRRALGESEQLIRPRMGTRTADLDTARQQLDALSNLSVALCSEHSFGRLLILYRKITHDVTVSILGVSGQYTSTSEIGTIAEQAVLFGTNCIVQYAQKLLPFSRHNDRYGFVPTVEEIEAALTLTVYALVHRDALFYANTAARRPLGQPVSFDFLIESYNRRMENRQRHRLAPPHSPDRVLIVPSFVFHVPVDARAITINLKSGESRTIMHRNYAPVAMDFDLATRPYEYLETALFQAQWGVTFDIWKKMWCALNMVLRDSVLTLWSANTAAAADVDLAAAAAERADDYADTALGSGRKESIVAACHAILESRGGEESVARAHVQHFVERLTAHAVVADVSFVEQPCLFYEMGPGLVFWDYLRHGGLLRAVARTIAARRAGARIGDTSGRVYEQLILEKIAVIATDPGTMKTNVALRRGKRKIWEIDVGFVFGRALVIVEVKHNFKSVAYHSAHGGAISNRVQSRESLCDRLDAKLQDNVDGVRSQWPGVVGAICVICTEETEFIASAEQKYWLSLADIPRVCTVDELLQYAREYGEQAFVDHPSFVTFSAHLAHD